LQLARISGSPLLSRSKSRTEPLLEILSQESGIQHERA
jgi:hypothetical protein